MAQHKSSCPIGQGVIFMPGNGRKEHYGDGKIEKTEQRSVWRRHLAAVSYCSKQGTCTASSASKAADSPLCSLGTAVPNTLQSNSELILKLCIYY